MFGNRFWGARFYGDRYFGPGGAGGPVIPPAPAPEQPTGGWEPGAWERYRTPADLRRAREEERERLAITEAQQRKIDRAAVKIARRVAKEGLNADQPTVMAMPSFDALLAALRPNEGQAVALAEAIMARLAWAAAAERADEEAAIMALLTEI